MGRRRSAVWVGLVLDVLLVAGVLLVVARDELEADCDADRIEQLATRMRASRAQMPSLAQALADHVRAPEDPNRAFHVERLQPPTPELPDPAPALEIAP